MSVLGVDIGSAGALALVSDAGELVEVADIPILADGPNGRPTICAPLLSNVIRRWSPGEAFVEHVGTLPTDGRVGAFAFGRARGVLEGVLGALAVSTKWLTVPTWRRAVGLPATASKDAARSEAIRRWPANAELFARIRDDGRAEAALIAVAGILRSRST
jgi:crossover junction endodeoxyribonuclease RuvC